MSALAGIDQALWDIAGKVRGVPVHELLGGPVRERVRVYSWIGGDDPSEVAEQAAAHAAAGHAAIKMNGSGRLGHIETPSEVRAVVARAERVRERSAPTATWRSTSTAASRCRWPAG